MAKFVVLINSSSDEEAQVKDLPNRLAAGHEAAGPMGITIECYYLTFGRFDAIAIIDAPDGPTAAQFILSTIGAGSVRTETMTAFGEDQIRSIADGLLD